MPEHLLDKEVNLSDSYSWSNSQKDCANSNCSRMYASSDVASTVDHSDQISSYDVSFDDFNEAKCPKDA